jgi:hypothetical protein
MYNNKLCHIIGRSDLKAPARHKPLSEIKQTDILPSCLSKAERIKAQLIVLKISSHERVILKDALN